MLKTRKPEIRYKMKGQEYTTLVYRILLQNSFEAERCEWYTVTNEMFAHCFDPVETEGVKHSTGSFHHTENGDSKHEPKVERNDSHDHSEGWRGLEESVAESHAPKDGGKLLMGKRKSPETEVGGSVRYTVKTEF